MLGLGTYRIGVAYKLFQFGSLAVTIYVRQQTEYIYKQNVSIRWLYKIGIGQTKETKRQKTKRQKTKRQDHWRQTEARRADGEAENIQTG